MLGAICGSARSARSMDRAAQSMDPYFAQESMDRPIVLKTTLLNTRCLRAVNVTCIKSKVGLLQTAHSWANAGVLFGARVGRRVAFETIKLIHAKVLCVA